MFCGFASSSQSRSSSLHSTERCFTPEPQVTEHWDINKAKQILPLTIRVRGPYCQLRTAFLPLHEINYKKQGAVFYSTNRENEVVGCLFYLSELNRAGKHTTSQMDRNSEYRIYRLSLRLRWQRNKEHCLSLRLRFHVRLIFERQLTLPQDLVSHVGQGRTLHSSAVAGLLLSLHPRLICPLRNLHSTFRYLKPLPQEAEH